ncbi:hypothetical protein SKAU_G00233440 [Synaphobranchus kaupii]|uniref:Uncharacterized protein n=1 Tax=Synaphobranchus kaupii TaxID=118154 RepID=A0A9Q1F679_SYNKA|nr:hypothetical protein SKAU_G00233440 [Synaphobranchus kaupii]
MRCMRRCHISRSWRGSRVPGTAGWDWGCGSTCRKERACRLSRAPVAVAARSISLPSYAPPPPAGVLSGCRSRFAKSSPSQGEPPELNPIRLVRARAPFRPRPLRSSGAFRCELVSRETLLRLSPRLSFGGVGWRGGGALALQQHRPRTRERRSAPHGKMKARNYKGAEAVAGGAGLCRFPTDQHSKAGV